MADLVGEWATYLGKSVKEIAYVDDEGLTGPAAAQFLGIAPVDAEAMVGAVNPPAPEGG